MNAMNSKYPESYIDICNVFTPEALPYILQELYGSNKQAKAKLLKAVHESKIETKSFEDVTIDLRNFDWCSIEMDRNWWWQMQALPFLGWFAQSYKVLDPKQKVFLARYCLDALGQWLKQEPNSESSPLRWHDHASAYRLTNIVNWLAVVSSDVELLALVGEMELEVNLAEVINTHVTWLNEDDNFSRYTNHGFDQALAVYSLGLFVSSEFWKGEVETARDRLIEEVQFAFTEEGVHKENSPGYHAFMTRRLDVLVDLESIGDEDVCSEAKKIREGAERFLEAITLPDGTLPMVGDTRGGVKGRYKNIPEGPIVYDFSKSGYVIVKGRYIDTPYYLLMKNCFSSTYHRHDDDLHVYLVYGDSVILGDGGLGAHNEKDPNRIKVRSVHCHNIPCLEGRIASRSLKETSTIPSLSILGNELVGTSSMFGEELTRIVDFSGISNGEIFISDQFLSDPSSLYTNFFFTGSFRISSCGDLEILENDKVIARVEPKVDRNSGLRITYNESVFSEIYNKYKRAVEVKYSLRTAGSLVYRIKFQ